MAAAAKDVDKEGFIKVLNLDLVQINNGNNSDLLQYGKNYEHKKVL